MRLLRALSVAVIVTALVSCSHGGDEQQVREALSAMQSAVEDRQSRLFVSYLAEGFEDQQGRNADAIRAYLAGLFLRNKSIHVFLNNIETDVKGSIANTRCLLVVTGGQGIIPERMRRLVLLLEWKKQSGNWKVYRVNWHEVSDGQT